MTKAVFLGASTVEGVGASEPKRRYSSLVSRALGWDELNFGIGGTTVTGRDDEGQVVALDSGIGRVPEVIEAHPDIVFIHHGANDFAQSVPLGDLKQFRQGTFLWDYDTMLRGLLDALEPDRMFLSTLQYRADAETANGQGLTLADYNRVIHEAGERYGVCVLDPYSHAGIDAGNWPSLAADDAHLNDTGHQVLAAFYTESINRHLCQ
jgi:lysophospholipase L1-like esterase